MEKKSFSRPQVGRELARRGEEFRKNGTLDKSDSLLRRTAIKLENVFRSRTPSLSLACSASALGLRRACHPPPGMCFGQLRLRNKRGGERPRRFRKYTSTYHFSFFAQPRKNDELENRFPTTFPALFFVGPHKEKKNKKPGKRASKIFRTDECLSSKISCNLRANEFSYVRRIE